MDFELLLEAERRGILPQDKVALLAEARKRGLVDGGVAQPRADAEPAPPQEKSFGQKLKENLLGDDDPTTQNLGEKVGTFLNKAGESMTFGLVGDETGAKVESLLPGVNYETRRDHYRDQEKLLEETNPGAALTAEIGGGLVGPVGAIGVAKGIGKGALNLASRMAASGLATGSMAGTYGFMEGEGGLAQRADDAVSDAKVGAGLGAAIPVVGGAVQKAANSRAAKKHIADLVRKAPSSDDLKTLGQKAYRDVENAGVQVRPESFNRMRSEIVGHLRKNTGFDELPGGGSLTPYSARTMQKAGEMASEMGEEATAALPFSSLDQLRRNAGVAAGNFTNKADAAAGSEIIRRLDDFVTQLGPDDVISGDVDALKTAIPKAREIWAKMSRSETIDEAISKGMDYRSGVTSGIKNQFANLLKNKKAMRGFSDAERAVMKSVVNGGPVDRLLDMVGSGMGQIMSTAGGAAAGAAIPGGPIIGALAGGGASAAARKLAEKSTLKNAETVRALVANGGLKALPKASDNTRLLIEQLLRQGTAAGLH